MRASLTVTICLAATLAIPASLATDGRVLEILLMGDIYPCPAIVLGLIDPAFEYTPVQTREIAEDQARRYVRLYFPRSAEALTHYAAIFFVDADMSPFSGPQVGAMLDAVAEGHVGTFWTFGPHYGSVASSALSVVVPHEMSANFNSWAWGHSFYRVTFRRDRPPVFTPFIELGVEDVRAYGCGQISPRRGTVIWGDLIPFP